MRLFPQILGAAALVATMATAHSAAATTVTQNGLYEATNVKTGSDYHTFWFPNLVAGNAHYQFVGSSGSFEVTDLGARIYGSIVQNGNAANVLDVDISFSYLQTGTGGGVHGKLVSVPNPAITDMWDFFTYSTISVAGAVGSLLDGVELDLTIKPSDGSMPPQLGKYASAKGYDLLGFSSWYDWTVTKGASDGDLYRTSGRGDINVNLSPIPLPAGAVLLLSALGLGAVTAKRRKS